MVNEKIILDNIDLESIQGLSVGLESANGIANSTKSAVGTFNQQQNQTNTINSTTGNEQISASGLFTSSQVTTPTKKQ